MNRVTLGDKVVGGSAILLILVLGLAPWHAVFSMRFTATEGSGAFVGSAAMALTGGILLSLIARRAFLISPPDLPRPIGEVTLGATITVLALLLIKLALDTTYLGFGAFIAIVLAGVMVGGAVLGRTETDEAPPVGTGPGAPPTPF